MSNPKESETGDFLKDVTWIVFSTAGTLVVFFLLMNFLRFALNVPFSLWIDFLIIFWFLSVFIFYYFVKNQKIIFKIQHSIFAYFVFELALLTVIIHFIGGVEWFGMFFYCFFIIYGVFLLPKRLTFDMILVSLLFYFGLVFLEYNNVISHYNVFPGEEPYQNFRYVFSNLMLLGGVFLLLYAMSDRFASSVKNQNLKLKEAQDMLSVSNIKLTAAVKELEYKNKEVERERTIAEKFNQLAVGRELKMVELKKKIHALEDELKGAR